MSLITRCPACGTMFKVVADQLKVSQGWVRCGQCAEVFDATVHLLPRELPASSPASFDTQEAQALPVGVSAHESESERVSGGQGHIASAAHPVKSPPPVPVAPLPGPLT